MANQVISNTGLESPCSTQETIYGERELPLLPFGYLVSLPFEGLMVRVPHHDPEHGRRVRAGLRVSLPSILLGAVSPSNHSRTLSLSNRSNPLCARLKRRGLH
ncbi:MAG: hypothetical protein V3U06_08310 [Candidatus Binatia bacterium]